MFFNEKKRHFKKKLKGSQKLIWDLEFKRFKTLEIREEIRQQYDGMKSKLAIVKNQIEAEKKQPTVSPDELKRLEDSDVVLTRDSERLLAQMKHLDVEVNGSAPTEEYPDGMTGLNPQLESLRELIGMLKEYIKREL